jgi:hypothetical protein
LNQQNFKVFTLVLLLGIAAQFLLGALLESSLRSHLARLESRQIPTRCSQLNLPEVKLADNGANCYRAAIDLVGDLKFSYDWDEWTLGKKETMPSQTVPLSLPRLKQALALVQEGNRLPGCRLLDYSAGYFLDTPYTKPLAQLAAVSAQIDVGKGRAQAAVDTVLPVLRMLLRLQPELSRGAVQYSILLSSQDWLLRPLERLAEKHVQADYREVVLLLAESHKLHKEGPQQACNGLRAFTIDLYHRYSSDQPVPQALPWLYSLGGRNMILLDELAWLRAGDVAEREVAAAGPISTWHRPFYVWIGRNVPPHAFADGHLRDSGEIRQRMEQLQVALQSLSLKK